MTAPLTPSTRERLSALGQTHLLEHLASLESTHLADAQAFAEALAELDLDLLKEQRALLLNAEQAHASQQSSLEPAEMLALNNGKLHPDALAARERGESLLEQGKVAALLLAGGQGTRLGFDAPKGFYPIYPLSERCLFEGFAAQINELAGEYGTQPHFLVMTSDATHEFTLAALEDMEFFGLDQERTHFFQQAQSPALDAEGRLLLESPTTLAQSPDGHGGTLTALRNFGLLKMLIDEGVEWLFTFQVDNPVVTICDPCFVGLNAAREAEASLLAVRKRDAAEKVGVFGYRDGKPAIIEYSELSDEQANQRNDAGELAWAAGNCAVHVFSTAFLERFTNAQREQSNLLPLHVAHKAVPHFTSDGHLVEPDAPNAYKFERFIFDCLPHAANVYALEIDRASSFLPIKSATGETSPAAVRHALMQLWRSELKQLGLVVGEQQLVEISPELWANRHELAILIDQLRPQLEQAIADPTTPLLIES